MTGFPSHLLKPGQRVLSLFCAAFGGAQDVKYIQEAGIKDALLVDHDLEKLSAMPFPYQQKCADCFEFIDSAVQLGVFDGMAAFAGFDVVISDHWSSLDEKIHGEYLEKIKALAPIRIIGVCQPYLDANPVDGELWKRSMYLGGCYWRVL